MSAQVIWNTACSYFSPVDNHLNSDYYISLFDHSVHTEDVFYDTNPNQISSIGFKSDYQMETLLAVECIWQV